MAQHAQKRSAPDLDEEDKRLKRPKYGDEPLQQDGDPQKHGHKTKVERRRSPDNGRHKDARRSPEREHRRGTAKNGRESDRRNNRARLGSPTKDHRTSSPHRHRSPKRNGTRERSVERPRYDKPRERPPAAKSRTNEVNRSTSRHIKSSEVKAEKMEFSVELSGDELEQAMMVTMGFGRFKSTKNTKVPGNDKLYGVRKEKKAEYRQYMNRVGGFNRPLSPS